jgi:hypothetical protein
MGGSKTTIQQPDPIDPGKAMGEYLFGSGFSSYQGITDPRLQAKILAAESAYRPQYTALELSDIATMAYGIEDPKQDPQYRKLQAELAGLKAGKGGVSDAEAMKIARRTAGSAPQRFEMKTRKGFRGRGSRTVKVENKNYDAELKAYNAEVNKIAESLGGNREARIAQIETQMAGLEKAGGTPGLFTMLEDQSRRAGELQREQLGLQRADDVSALREFAPQVVEAYREADPYSTELAEAMSAEAMRGPSEAEQLLGERGLELAASTGELTTLEARRAQQSARAASAARGRGLDQSALYGEMQSRMAEEMGKRERELALGSQLLGQQAGLQQQRFGQLGGALGAQRQLAGDVGMTILGRPSAAIGLGGQMLSQAQAGAAGPMGPQLFDPNVGINMAMQQRSQDINLMGAQAQADASRSAGKSSMFGSIAGAMIGLCWVAREVYGVDNPKWLQFREWMLEDSPSWFRSLYIKYGERFAKFISNKPLLKTIIRKWMNTRIK